MTELLPYQYKGACNIRDFGGCALLADEMGLGKTLQVLYWCMRMAKQRPVIVVCPATLKWTWQREAKRHLNMASEVLSGRKPPRLSSVFLDYHQPILIINYEILHCWVDYLVKLQPRVVIWDEAHYVQSRTSLRTCALKRLIVEARVPYRIALSGTPLTNRTVELWPTLNMIRPEEWGSFADFAAQYSNVKWQHDKFVYTGGRNKKELHARLMNSCMIRRLKRDVMSELPHKVREMVVVELSRADRAEYTYASEHFIEWLKRWSPTRAKRAKQAEHLVKIGYLLRLLAKMTRFDALEWIENFHAESDEKLVVFSMHAKLIAWLHRRFPDSSVVIDGSVTGLKRQNAVDAFQSNQRITDAFCNPKAAGLGLTLTASSNVFYTDFPWTPGTLKQGEDRIHRIGQSKRCFIWFLAARRTVSERLCELLIDKQDILDGVLDGVEDGHDFDIFAELFKPSTKKEK